MRRPLASSGNGVPSRRRPWIAARQIPSAGVASMASVTQPASGIRSASRRPGSSAAATPRQSAPSALASCTVPWPSIMMAASGSCAMESTRSTIYARVPRLARAPPGCH